METRRCSKCEQEKPLDEFHKDARTKDGRTAACGECRSRTSRAWYHRDPNARQERERRYYANHQAERIAKQVERDRQRLYKNPEEVRAYRAAYMREYNRKNHDRVRDNYLRRVYGISLGEYRHLLERQGFGCAICEIPEGKGLAVDHSHKTGKVRGLLCKKCNSAIAYLGDEPERCEAAVRYLRK